MKIDNIYGPKTSQAVLNFQQRYPHLAHDGTYGPRTLIELLRYAEQARAAENPTGADEPAMGAGAPRDHHAGDRAVRLAREYGAGLGQSTTHGGPAPNLRDAFSTSPETGGYDTDALEVATTLRVPHRTDIPMTRKILERDGDILYAAIGAQAKALNDEKRRQKKRGKSSRRR